MRRWLNMEVKAYSQGQREGINSLPWMKLNHTPEQARLPITKIFQWLGWDQVTGREIFTSVHWKKGQGAYRKALLVGRSTGRIRFSFSLLALASKYMDLFPTRGENDIKR